LPWRKEGRSELVVSRGYASEIFEFVEEALDQITLLVEPWREADRCFPVSLRRDIRPTALLRDHRAQPIGVVGAIGEHHLPFADPVQQLGGCQDVVGLAR
jgi:hypothetical protein